MSRMKMPEMIVFRFTESDVICSSMPTAVRFTNFNDGKGHNGTIGYNGSTYGYGSAQGQEDIWSSILYRDDIRKILSSVDNLTIQSNVVKGLFNVVNSEFTIDQFNTADIKAYTDIGKEDPLGANIPTETPKATEVTTPVVIDNTNKHLLTVIICIYVFFILIIAILFIVIIKVNSRSMKTIT